MPVYRDTVNDYYFSPTFGWDTVSQEISEQLVEVRELIKSTPLNQRRRRYLKALSGHHIVIKLDQAGIITGEYLVETNGGNLYFEICRGASSPWERGVFGPADSPEFMYD
jgi:hypothetical protein